MMKFFENLYKKLKSGIPTSSVSEVRRPNLDSAAKQDRSGVHVPLPKTILESQGVFSKTGELGWNSKSPTNLSHSPSKDLEMLFAKYPGLTQISGGTKLSEAQIHDILVALQDRYKTRLLHDFLDRKEKTNSSSSSSPVGGI